MTTILIVDDEITLCVLIRKILEYKGYNTLLAHNGFDALRVLEQQPVDLVLLDVMMPGLTGVEVCQRIRSNPAIAEIPIIILTACPNADTRINALSAGADQIRLKPFDMDELILTIHNLIETPVHIPAVAQNFRFCT